ncbi:Acetyltransferase (GNAT) domain-containing protein [Reichenbachiella agariperforans]|uniref:Acetyltransferase (GNAT) domain-containing protein n=1 Tax=Reichenbachiella agariperforans TaxID=156994 RepID=A0A1M6R9K8_REIAG|nr:GNAT family N-acetyltransferase [Reichenbachiella agariperforans]SHK29132.1 Acetyltransferase (GNAT) domain-containing protein [Reichenbachiella agariperforans]
MLIKEVPLEDVWQMRYTIMYPETSLAYVKLPKDDAGKHYGLYDRGELMSVVSVFWEEGKLQFRKFCTRVDQQGKGYGSALLKYLFEELIPKHSVSAVWCNARTTAISIYERFGMTKTDQTYQKDGWDFVIMEKRLAD